MLNEPVGSGREGRTQNIICVPSLLLAVFGEILQVRDMPSQDLATLQTGMGKEHEP